MKNLKINQPYDDKSLKYCLHMDFAKKNQLLYFKVKTQLKKKL